MVSIGALGYLVVAASLPLAYAIIRPDQNACSGGVTLREQTFDIVVNETNCQQRFTTEYWRKEPLVFSSRVKPGRKYTLVMVDIEDPKTPYDVYFLNWLVANIPGEDLIESGDVAKNGDILASYIPPEPQEWKPHRIAVGIYEQKNPNIRVTGEISAKRRQYFATETFITTRETPLLIIGAIEIIVRRAPNSLSP